MLSKNPQRCTNVLSSLGIDILSVFKHRFVPCFRLLNTHIYLDFNLADDIVPIINIFFTLANIVSLDDIVPPYKLNRNSFVGTIVAFLLPKRSFN